MDLHQVIQNRVNFKFHIEEESNNYWETVKSRKNPLAPGENINLHNTHARLILFSRRSLEYDIAYDEECALYDDFATFLRVAELGLQGKLRVVRTSDTSMYIYNKMNNESASQTYHQDGKRERENSIFQKSIQGRFAYLRQHFNLASFAAG